jgi:cytidine deaminase
VSNDDLIQKAIGVLNPRKISSCAEAASVGCALLTGKGNIYTGVCIDTACGIGFCAEHSAIAAMVTAGETDIKTIVAVNWNKSIMAPCGRCREFMYQIDDNNKNADIIMPGGKVIKLSDLLPCHWMEKAA